jgi:uncharacterized protein
MVNGVFMMAIKQTPEGILVKIEVSPQSDKFQITGYNKWRETLEVKVKALPTKGKANLEVIKEFSRLTGRNVEIISGNKSQQKTLHIYKIDENEFLKILKELKVYLPYKW